MSLEPLQKYLAPTYENFPKGRFVGLIVLRTTLSETVFRTEGTGEPICREFVRAGIQDNNVLARLVMTKRKQVAPERRRGREFLRALDLLHSTKEGVCGLNTNTPCEMCIDCFVYGFAAGGGGAQKSRVWTEDAFSVLPAPELLGDRTLNGVFENGTMRDEKGKPSTSLNTSEYIKPGSHFLDVVTLKDVTADELRYVVGNILDTSRYGAISSRTGRMSNRLLGVYAGSTELPSSLELAQQVHDSMTNAGIPLEHPLEETTLIAAVENVIAPWSGLRGIGVGLSTEQLTALQRDVVAHWSEDGRETFLRHLDASYTLFRQKAEATPGRGGRGRAKTKDTATDAAES